MRTSGFRVFWGKGGLIFVGFITVQSIATHLIDEMREMTVHWKRKELTEQYRNKYVDEYLLKVLNPTFQLIHHH
jgi:hypothetical protein